MANAEIYGQTGSCTILEYKAAEGRMPVLDVDEVARVERRIADGGTSLLELMQRAGASLAEVAAGSIARPGRIVVLAGKGNNGGDGWVAASVLAGQGFQVTLVTKCMPECISAEPAHTAALAAENTGTFAVTCNPDRAELHAILSKSDAIIDAILGTGFSHSSVKEPFATWIQEANLAATSGIPVISADCPSGMDAQTANAADDCINATATVTMIAAKTGLVAPGSEKHTGSLLVAPLGVDVKDYLDIADARMPDAKGTDMHTGARSNGCN